MPVTRTMPLRMAYPIGEVAIQLGVSDRTVYRLIDDSAGMPELASINILGSRRVEHEQLVAYVAWQRKLAEDRAAIRAHATADPDEGGAGTGPGGGAGTGPRPPYPPKPGKARP